VQLGKCGDVGLFYHHPRREPQGGGVNVSGRCHNQTSTVAMQAIAAAAAHSLPTVSSRTTALADIVQVAAHLALRLTTPPRRQLRNVVPNSRWFSSQASRRGELRVAAHAASRMKGVVGNTGRNMPRKPRPRLSSASARSSHCIHRGSGFGTASGERWEGSDMPWIVPCDRKD